jgi:hypothetical protein
MMWIGSGLFICNAQRVERNPVESHGKSLETKRKAFVLQRSARGEPLVGLFEAAKV